jgi:malate/lactate dehydrogenase
LALDLLLGGKHGHTMVQLLDKSFCGIAFLVQLFHKFEHLTLKEQEKMVTDRALWMILYGLKVHLRDLGAVYLSFG